ncbi:MAG: hypothetical protein HZC40_26075 [Chloroflexi bacterium]|nr:hypothetical protein [Chloroflexota bacterium]
MNLDLWQDRDYEEILAFVEKNLWLLVQENAHIHKPQQVICNFTQLGYGELRLLQNIHFLLSSSVQQLVREDTSYLLRHLPQASSRITSETKNVIRGNVEWSKTLKLRWNSGGDPTLFVSRIATKKTATPEVQALKYLLFQVAHSSTEVLDLFSKKDTPSSYQESGKWKDNIRSLRLLSNRHLQNICIRDVILPNRMSGIWMQRVRCARATHFKSLYDSLNLYHKLFVRENQETLRECIANGVLKPLNRDTLYEIYVLFLTNAILERAGWSRDAIRLIGYGKGAVSRYKQGNRSLQVYYQTLPNALADNSLYTELLRKYGIDVSLRRPDILLEFEREKPNFVLVEVKRSRDKNYIVDSIYKIFGYLKDFDKSFVGSSHPHAILVTWELEGNYDAHTDVIVLLDRQNYQHYMERLSVSLAS